MSAFLESLVLTRRYLPYKRRMTDRKNRFLINPAGLRKIEKKNLNTINDEPPVLIKKANNMVISLLSLRVFFLGILLETSSVLTIFII